MAHENPLRPEDQEVYGTEVSPEGPALGKEPRDATPAAGAPPWILIAVVVTVIFVALLLSWVVFLAR